MPGWTKLDRFVINVDVDVYADGAADDEFASLIEALAPVAMHLSHLPRASRVGTRKLGRVAPAAPANVFVQKSSTRLIPW